MLLGSRARGAGALKVTPEGAEHRVQLPEPEREVTEALAAVWIKVFLHSVTGTGCKQVNIPKFLT